MATINILFILSEYSIFHPLTDIHLEARHPSRGPDAWMCSSGKGSVLAGEVTSACCRNANLEHNLCSQSFSPAVKTRFHWLLLAYMQAMFDEILQYLESLFRHGKWDASQFLFASLLQFLGTLLFLLRILLVCKCKLYTGPIHNNNIVSNFANHRFTCLVDGCKKIRL